jgi:hypothetical protein
MFNFSLFGEPTDITLKIFKYFSANELNVLIRISRGCSQFSNRYELWVGLLLQLDIKKEVLDQEIFKNNPKQLKRAYFQIKKHIRRMDASSITIENIVLATENVDFINLYLATYQRFVDKNLLKSACGCCSLDFLKLLIERDGVEVDEYVIRPAARSNTLEVFQYLCGKIKLWPSSYLDFLRPAALGGNTELVKYMTQTLKIKPTELVVDGGIESNSLEVVTSLIEDGNYWPTCHNVGHSSFCKDKKITEYLESKFTEAITKVGVTNPMLG